MPSYALWVIGIVMLVMIAISALTYIRVLHKDGELKAEHAKLEARRKELDRSQQQAVEIVENRKKEIILEAKDEAHRIRQEVEAETREKRAEALRLERRASQKEEALDRRIAEVEARNRSLDDRERDIEQCHAETANLKKQQFEKLQEIAKMSVEDARQVFLRRVEDESRHEAARLMRQIEEEAKRASDSRARAIIIDTIQRCTVERVNEATVSVVELPSDDMKGRIIGREGRNIRTFEQVLNVDLIIDDTPEAVVVSCFDPIRREVARIALLNLIVDGRIHPARIEEAAERAKSEVDRQIIEAGERAVLRAGIAGMHPELVKMMGRLRYRTSYGQNVLNHSIEVAFLAAHMAAEAGANIEVARRAAFLHDIGKGVAMEIEGPHALVGMDLARKYGESDAVAHAIGAHHAEIEAQSVEAALVICADSLSAARPGARRETLETYVKRLEKLETIADSFKGVEKSYAVQAGREIRIIVKPGEIDDYGSMELARGIAKRIEEEMEYPGQIKVTVIRETRAHEFAK